MEEKEEETLLEKVGAYLFIGPVAAGVMLAGFFDDWNVLPPLGWVAVSVVSTTLAAAAVAKHRSLAAMAGCLAGFGIPIAIIGYVSLRERISGTFLSIEFLIPALVGALPGILLYAFLTRNSDSDEHTPSKEFGDVESL